MTCRVADSNEDYTGSATYAFTIGRRAAAVKEDFVKKGFFADVPADSFYYEAVKWAVEKGITNGTDATHFDPDATCTRADRHVPLPALRDGVGAHEYTYII